MDRQDESRGPANGGASESTPYQRGQYMRRPRVCQFCIDQIQVIDYKQIDLLRRYVMERGKIRPRRQTGTCAKHQRALAVSVKRARHLALLAFVED
ncbi:MAG TPA: 30S ribosomal protein S18 [Anaerolineales bacterium]|nr:30S ribosomal protein S18 [Anaerolineales bacterium]